MVATGARFSECDFSRRRSEYKVHKTKIKTEKADKDVKHNKQMTLYPINPDAHTHPPSQAGPARSTGASRPSLLHPPTHHTIVSFALTRTPPMLHPSPKSPAPAHLRVLQTNSAGPCTSDSIIHRPPLPSSCLRHVRHSLPLPLAHACTYQQETRWHRASRITPHAARALTTHGGVGESCSIHEGLQQTKSHDGCDRL